MTYQSLGGNLSFFVYSYFFFFMIILSVNAISKNLEILYILLFKKEKVNFLIFRYIFFA